MSAYSERVTLVTLTLGRRMLAIPASLIREILDPLPVTRVPGAGVFVPGVVNVRGTVVPLADLAIALGLPAGPQDAARRRLLVLDIVLDGETMAVAITADCVHEVVTVAADMIEHVAASTATWPAEFVAGLYRGADDFVLLPDLPAIFAARLPGRAAA
jgi:purine-binding chemotaxis protein CheW